MRRCAERLMIIVISASSLLLMAADWPQFRGPASAGVSDEKGLPTTWDRSGKNILWKIPLPGFGASSPIVQDGRIYLTCYSGYGYDAETPGDIESLDQHIVCYNLADGSLIFDLPFKTRQPEKPYHGIQALHGYSSGTPATDGKHLFAFFGKTGVSAVTLGGEALWHQSVGTGTHGFGSGSSPTLHKNLVILNATVECGALVALDKKTGQEVWRAEEVKRAWNTPLVAEVPGGQPELIISGQETLFGYNPDTGEELWRCNGIQDYVCPSVIAHKGIVYSIGGRQGMAVAVRLGGRGDVTETHRLWDVNKGSNVSSPVYHDGHLYYVHEKNGIAYCINAASGKVVYEERIVPRPGLIYASPVLVEDKIYLVSREEGTYVLAAKPAYELVAHNEPLDESVFNASPAVADGRLLLRSDTFLYCLRTKSGGKTAAKSKSQF